MTHAHSDWVEMRPGVRRRILADGQAMMQVQIDFDPGAVVPTHQHMHEQISYVLSGSMRFTIDGQDVILNAGESRQIAGNVPHSATALLASTLVETFSPPREDFRPKA